MNIDQYYKILNISSKATDEEITASFKKLAFKYHPDKNPGRVEWATEAMTRLNQAYSVIMSHRFTDETRATEPEKKPPAPGTRRPAAEREYIDPEILTKQFIHYRESAKDALYRYFQYSLYAIPMREKISNQAVFNKIVFSLRKSYHAIRRLRLDTDDPELIEHFSVFTLMLFNFYRASECLNIIDSYSNQYDVEAFRIYRQGDESLLQANREIFYDRHNRGRFKSSDAYALIIQAEKIFQAAMKIFPDSSWAIETRIKLEYAQSLRRYLELFFTEEAG